MVGVTINAMLEPRIVGASDLGREVVAHPGARAAAVANTSVHECFTLIAMLPDREGSIMLQHETASF